MFTVTIINEELAFQAFQDRIIVLEDEYKSGRECSTCKGKGHTGEECSYCKGTGFFKGDKEMGACPDCEVGTSDMRRSLGHVICSVCKGTGSSSIIIPEDQQARPTTGVVKSIGPLCGKIVKGGQWVDLPEEAQLKIGDRVAYTTYCGNKFEFPRRADSPSFSLRVLKEAEIQYIIKGVLKSSQIEDGFAELKDVGMNV